jgi:hypothetical protein
MHPTAQSIESPRPMNLSQLHVLGSGLPGDTWGDLGAGGLGSTREPALLPPMVRVGLPFPDSAPSGTKPASRDHTHRRLLLAGRWRGVAPEAGTSGSHPQLRASSIASRDQSPREAVPLDLSTARLTGRQT